MPVTMISRRKQLQQQLIIYGGSSVQSFQNELLRRMGTAKKQIKDVSRMLPSKQLSNYSLERNSSLSFPKTAQTDARKDKCALQKSPKAVGFSPSKSSASKSEGVNVTNNDLTKRRSQQRPPVYIPPMNIVEKPIPRNVVTIDTSKARGNTDLLRLVARDLGWREIQIPRRDFNCDVIWHCSSFNDQVDISSGVLNKLPGAVEAFHKVNLFRQLILMKQLFPNDFNFFPRTWVLPAQFHEFCIDVRQMTEWKSKPRPTFIIKPSEGSQGGGIYLLRDPQQYMPCPNRSHVAQEYLTNILLIDGYKFDLRVYVVVKQLNPLEVHICTEGLARFSTIPYENPNSKNLHEMFMHLTNYSLNKHSATFNKSEKDDEGSKRKLTSVFRQMERMGYNTQDLWRGIENIVCKTLISVAGELKVEYQATLSPGKPHPSCFQVLGFDILVLRDLRPVLLEVNANPSLSITAEYEVSPGIVEYKTSAKDEEVKRSLIRDTLILIAPKNKFTRKKWKQRKRQQAQQVVEEMDVDPIPGTGQSTETRHRNHRRERDITIHFQGEDSAANSEIQKSIFAENDKMHPAYQRQETCRVFIEGEGEVTRFSTPPFYKQMEESSDLNQNSTASDFEESKTTEESQDLQPSQTELSLVGLSGEEDNDEEKSCLKEIFPAIYAEDLKHTRLLERLSDIFLSCVSIRGSLRLGPTSFRMFGRKCHLNRIGLNNAAVDILYIDMQRKWEFLNPDRTSGLCFQGFVDACLEIARRKFSSSTLCEMLEDFISYCETNLKVKRVREDEDSKDERDFLRFQRSMALVPQRMITSHEEEEAAFKRRCSVVTEVSNFIRDMQNRNYVPSILTQLKRKSHDDCD